MVPTRNKEPPLSKNWATIFADRSFTNFWLLFSFWIYEYSALEIKISTNSHTRYIKVPKRNQVLMVHNSINNNNSKKGSYLKYTKYGVFTLHMFLYIYEYIYILWI
jgi:hypothetical protein